MTRPALILICLTLAGCGAAHEGDYPALVPMETLLDEAPLTPSPAPVIEARAEALNARAEALRHETP